MPDRCPRTRALAICIGLGAMTTSPGLAADPPPIVFASPLPVLSGDFPAIASADFNGDGRKDLAVVDPGTFGVQILLGLGNGSFTPAPIALGSLRPADVAAADFNRDGRQDIVAADDLARAVIVAFGNGDGTFTAGPAYATGLAPSYVAPADFNGDGWPDLLVGGPFFGITVFFNLHDGVMGTRLDVWPDPGPPVLGGRVNYEAADFDGDGRDDIVAAGFELFDFECFGDGFVFYRSLGQSFSRALFPGSTCPLDLAVADWNRDGRRDVLLLSFGGFQVYGNLGGGSFSPPSSLFTTLEGERMAVRDFNLDGLQDVAVCRSFSLSPRTGRDDGTLSPPGEPVNLSGDCVDRVSDDFDDDGLPDLALALNDTESGRVHLLLNRSVPPPSPVSEPPLLHATGYDPASGSVMFTYAPACGATDHSVIYGSLDPPNRGAYVGRACGLGTGGTGAFIPGPGSVFFLVAGNNGTIEGSYGRTSTGVERPESSGLGVCDRPQVLVHHCP